jgi:hypothetical protein
MLIARHKLFEQGDVYEPASRGGNMVGLGVMKDREYVPKTAFVRMVVSGSYSLAKVVAVNAGTMKQLNAAQGTTEFYVRPVRAYTLPAFRDDMSYYRGDDKYRRPTLFCDPHAPEIVALAHALGAFDKPAIDFVEAAHEFVKRNIFLEIMAMDGVAETLKRGTGTCLQINSVFAALCRAAGIKARYKLFSARPTAAMYDDVYDTMAQQWYDALGFFSLETDIEVYLDGQWMLANVAPVPARQAAMGSPITHLGEGSIGNWFEAVPGTIMVTESLPYGIGLLLRLLVRLASGSVNKVNVNLVHQRETGAEIIARAGSEMQYDAHIRKRRCTTPELELSYDKNIKFA